MDFLDGRYDNVKDVLATNAKEAIAFCEENDVRFVRLWFTDLLGQLKRLLDQRCPIWRTPLRAAWASTAPRSAVSTRSRSPT